jgi:hypothetical protein
VNILSFISEPQMNFRSSPVQLIFGAGLQFQLIAPHSVAFSGFTNDKETMMFDWHKKKIAVVGSALLASMGLAGAAVAANSSTSTTTPPASTATSATTAPDTETNDTSTAPDKETKDAAGAADTDNVQSGDQSAPDTGAAESSSESSSEVPGGDGPGGHADEPANPNAAN